MLNVLNEKASVMMFVQYTIEDFLENSNITGLGIAMDTLK